MQEVAWGQVMGDLASTRRSAAVFLENLESIAVGLDFKDWATRWRKIGDAYHHRAELIIRRGGSGGATEAWLCALTAFEVARRLVDENDPRSREISTKIEASVRTFGLFLEQKLERVQIACCDEAKIVGHYLPAGDPDSPAAAAICISSEQETEMTLLGRLLPLVIGRNVSVLVVSHDDISNCFGGQSASLLSCCLDYLSVRPDVEATRIGAYGEGLSAALATDFAASDRRIVAAVCDGGLWNWARARASIDWITKSADVADEDIISERRLRLMRQLRCPALVIAGGRGVVDLSEAFKLQADCVAAGIDLELTIPPMTCTPVGEIENFVKSDDCIFRWLEHKLVHGSAHNGSEA